MAASLSSAGKKIFHSSVYKHHLLVFSGILWLSFSSAANGQHHRGSQSQVCFEEQLGTWTGNMLFKPGMNLSIENGPGDGENVVLQLRENRKIKGKILLVREGDDMLLHGIGIMFQTPHLPPAFLKHNNKVTLSFQITETSKEITLWNDTTSVKRNINWPSGNIDSVRIYSNKTRHSYSKTVVNICNSDEDMKVSATGHLNQKSGSSADVITCPPCPETNSVTKNPTTAACPTFIPCPILEKQTCPPCSQTSMSSKAPCPSIKPCPIPVEITCPSCPKVTCPSVSPTPATVPSYLSVACPPPITCPPTETTYQEIHMANKTDPDPTRYDFFYQEEWRMLLIYGLAGLSSALLLVSFALATALCKAKRQCKEPQENHCNTMKPSQQQEWNNTTTYTKCDNNIYSGANLQSFSHQPPVEKVTEDEVDSDFDTEEWDNKEAIYANIHCLSDGSLSV